MLPSSQRKLLWQSLAETYTLSLRQVTTDSGKSTGLMTHLTPKSISTRWSTPALQSLFQTMVSTGPRGLPMNQGPTSGGVR